MSSGKATALVIAVVATPVISRLFDPSDYGVASFFIANMAIMASILALAYERAVIFPKGNRKAGGVLVLSLTVSAFVTLGIYLVILAGSLLWPDQFQQLSMGGFIWLLPLAALLASLRSTAVAICIRLGNFSALATADVVEAAVSASSRILWGLVFASSVAGLLAGHLLGTLVAILICGFRCLSWFRKSYRRVSFAEMRRVAHEFRDYPIFRAPAKIAFNAASRMPIIALGILFPVEVVGFYAMANRAAGLPLQTVSKSVSNVLLSKTMALRHVDQPMTPSLRKVVIALALSGLPVFSIMFLYGEEILGWFLGARWSEAGRFVEILAPYLYALWVCSFASSIFETLRVNKIRLKLHLGNLSVRIAIFVYCGMSGLNIMETLHVFVVVSSTYQLVIFGMAAKVTADYDAGLRMDSAGKPDVDTGAI